MNLSQFEPVPISSLIRKTWKAEVVPTIVGLSIACIAFLVPPPFHWLVLILAGIVGALTDYKLEHLRHRRRIEESRIPPEEFPDPPEFDIEERKIKWRELTALTGVRYCVLFSYGTCVVLTESTYDPESDAKALLSEYGHVIPGTSSADMLVYDIPPPSEYVIGGYHPNILTYVCIENSPEKSSADSLVQKAAYYGRDLRVLDTFSLNVVDVIRRA